MKIALAQVNVTVGKLEHNYDKIVEYINKARDKGADVVAFPELALCGYPPEDLIYKTAFLAANQEYIHKLAKASKGITTVVGFVDVDEYGIYNSLAVLRDGEIIDTYNKIKLPNYGVFDEKRYFSAGEEVLILEHNSEKICLSICEDIWQGAKLYRDIKKSEEFSLMINISSSPYNHGKLKAREKVIAKLAKNLKTPIAYCNLVGGQDELIFDGGSLAVSANGEIVKHAKRFAEDLLIFNTNTKAKAIKVVEEKLDDSYNAILLGIKDYVHKNGFEKVVIGLSGGIDSALVAALAVKALGKMNVVGVTMPSVYSSSETLNDAIQLAKNLGIKCHVVPIKNMINTFADEIEPIIEGDSRWYDLACQNMQARMRGNILMTISNRYGYLVLNTGNKSEVSVGYCTLYGDMVGGYSVLKDVYKTKVFKLSRYINKISKKELIPVTTITRPPSAELKDDQKDEDELLPYPLLDKILKLYIEEDCSRNEIVEKGFADVDVAKVIALVDRNEYKRRQAPPGVRITPRAFGKDRRMPITNGFKY